MKKIGIAGFYFLVIFKLQLFFISVYMKFSFILHSNIVSYRTKSEKSYTESNEGHLFNAKSSISNFYLIKIKLLLITS